MQREKRTPITSIEHALQVLKNWGFGSDLRAHATTLIRLANLLDGGEHRESQAYQRTFELRSALGHVQCYAATREGHRCTRGSCHARDGRPVCTPHHRAKRVRWAAVTKEARRA